MAEPLEPPYGIIWDLWKAGKVIPFLGAGASLIGRAKLKLFSVQDLRSPAGLVVKLQKDTQELLSQYLREQFTPQTRVLLDQCDRFNPPPELLQQLVDELNQLIKGPSLFHEQRFAQIQLPEETQKFIQCPPIGEELARFNRLLLEDAYPHELKNQKTWNSEDPAFLPSGLELASFLADKAQFPSKDPRDLYDLAKVSSYCVDASNRNYLRQCLREVFDREYEPGPLHQFLAAVPAHQLIVTTNYDTFIEQAFHAAGKPYDLVIYPTDRKDLANASLWWRHGESKPEVVKPNALDIDLTSTTVIYKMHGTVIRKVHSMHATNEWDSFVITEEDYVEFLSRMMAKTAIPPVFLNHAYAHECSFLFLGYSLRDWNLRVVLRNLSKQLLSKRPDVHGEHDALFSWAIQYNLSILEQELWRKRNVRIFDLTLDEFVSKMRDYQGN